MCHKYSLIHLTDIYSPPPELIRAAAYAGYDYVSLRTIPMGLPNEKPYDLTDKRLFTATKNACEETGIKVNDTENARIIEGRDVRSYEKHLAVAAEFGIKHILTNIWTPDRAFYTEQFGLLCEIAKQYEQDVNVEFVTWASITNIKEAAKLLRDVGCSNVGIVLDTLHFYRSRCQLSDLEGLPAEWFRYAHLCDCERSIPTEVDSLIHTGREERLYPGEGSIDLKSILSKLPASIVRGIEVPHIERVREIGTAEHAKRALNYAKQYFGE